MRDQETESAMEEAEIRNLELQLQKKMFEQVKTRDRIYIYIMFLVLAYSLVDSSDFNYWWIHLILITGRFI